MAGPAGQRRVLRGGSFNNNSQNARCAYRNHNDIDNLNNNNGFRVAASHFPSRVGISAWCAVSFARNAMCSRMHGRGKTGEKARLSPGWAFSVFINGR